MANLTYIDFALNDFSGDIPSQLGLLTALTKLSMHQNQQQHAIPSQVGNLVMRGGVLIFEQSDNIFFRPSSTSSAQCLLFTSATAPIVLAGLGLC